MQRSTVAYLSLDRSNLVILVAIASNNELFSLICNSSYYYMYMYVNTSMWIVFPLY